MTPRTIPEHPQFADDSEELVWRALRAGLRPQDVLLHGVRITDPLHGEVEIDLLVLMPDVGVAVIEVKGGHVTYSGGQWHQGGADGSHAIDPVRQARHAVYALREFLQGGTAWSRGPVRAAWLVALPYTPVSGPLGPEARRDLILDRDDVASRDHGGIAGRVYDRLADPALPVAVPAPGWVDAAVDRLQGTANAPAEVAGRAAARLRHVDQLTAQQATLLNAMRLNPRIEVTGVAGTGKTWLAMEQARRWTEAGERVCFVAYGRGVIAMAAHAFSEMDEGSRPAFVGTFHQLGYEWGVRAADDESAHFWEHDAPEQMLSAAARLDPGDRYTAFVVDEAQDFADTWWPTLLAAAASDAFRLAVFRDDEQSVFHERRGRPELSMVPLVLDENLRNAQQIVDTFRPLIHADVISRGGDGYPVEFIHCAPSDVIARADDVVESLVQERGWLPEQVALLTTKHRHPVQVERSVDKTEYWRDLWFTDDVFYATVAGFKGLERPVVVLAVDGFHDGIDPASVLYSGMSRARDLLIVVGDRRTAT